MNKSCNWKNEEVKNKNSNERVGKKFKYLTCVEYKNCNECAFICICGCVIHRAWRYVVKNPHQSCGCKKKEGIIKFHKSRRLKLKIGKKINYWTVLENLGIKKYHNHKNCSFFKVQCKCGSLREYTSHEVFRIKSCGCIKQSVEYKKKMSVIGGKSMPYNKVAKIKSTINSKIYSMYEVCKIFDISEATYRNIENNITYKFIGTTLEK